MCCLALEAYSATCFKQKLSPGIAHRCLCTDENGSAPLNEVVLDSARVASKDASGLDKSTDNPNPTGNLNNGNNSTVQVPEGYVDGRLGVMGQMDQQIIRVERTDCLACVELKVNADNRWEIKRFIDEHNHPLASPNKTFMLRSHRKKSAAQRAVLTESDFYYGVKPAPVQQFRPEVSAGVRDIPVVAKNQVSYLITQRSKDFDKGDAQFLLDFLKVKQSEDPSFVYAIQLDEKERLTNCFWTDAKSVVDYSYFDDAVTLETTYRSSGFDLPFAAFLGVNHPKQVITFGAALLLDECVQSFYLVIEDLLDCHVWTATKNNLNRSLSCNIQSSCCNNACRMSPAMFVAYT